VTPAVGVGPHPRPWPADPRLDPALLATGDTRNVVDQYRYWRVEAIAADLDTRRRPFSVAIENWQHDANIGSIVRTANAFLARDVHIVGRWRWNRRGAMVTDRYQRIHHHPDLGGLLDWAAQATLPVIGVDNVPGAALLPGAHLPPRCLLLFGQEGPGLTPAAQAGCAGLIGIHQIGSTRSINLAVAAGIVMYEWVRQHGGHDPDPAQ